MSAWIRVGDSEPCVERGIHYAAIHVYSTLLFFFIQKVGAQSQALELKGQGKDQRLVGFNIPRQMQGPRTYYNTQCQSQHKVETFKANTRTKDVELNVRHKTKNTPSWPRLGPRTWASSPRPGVRSMYWDLTQGRPRTWVLLKRYPKRHHVLKNTWMCLRKKMSVHYILLHT